MSIKQIFFSIALFLLISNIGALAQEAPKSNLFRAAGLTDDNVFITHFNKLKFLVERNNPVEIEAFLHSSYPINVSIDKPNSKKMGETLSFKITNKEDFLKNYQKVFDLRLRNYIIKQKLSEFSCNYMGVMLGRGQIWWHFNKKTAILKIASISNINIIYN